jgi:transcriptional regulator with XRE-family HTH domain
MTDLAGPDPTIHRRRLRSELRKAREAAGLTQRQTAEAMDWSLSKLIRIETGDVRVSTNDLRAMLTYYTVDPERISALVDLAKAAREQPRWARYKDVASAAYLAFLGYESSATIIRNFEPTLVPGLLQTEEYAREVLAAVEPAERVDSLVDLRIERQEIIFRKEAPELNFIIDESVIRHLVGGPDVMRRQLVHLKELAAQPHIHLRVVTFDNGIYPRMRIPYVIFEFDAPEDEDVLYIENATNELVIKENSPLDTERDGPVEYLQSFWRLEQLAPSEDAISLLESTLEPLAGRQNGAS